MPLLKCYRWEGASLGSEVFVLFEIVGLSYEARLFGDEWALAWCDKESASSDDFGLENMSEFVGWLKGYDPNSVTGDMSWLEECSGPAKELTAFKKAFVETLALSLL